MDRKIAALFFCALLFPALASAQSTATPVLPGLLVSSGCPTGYTYCYVPYSNTNPLPVSGSFSATLAGFTPNGNIANLSVTSSSGNVALPAGTVVAVNNTGSNNAHIKLSVGAGTAATTDFVLSPGATVGLTVGSNTFINAITDSSTTTLSIAGGSGLVTGYGGGGSGSGGNVTIVGPLGSTTSSASVPVVIASDQAAVAVKQATAANLNATVVGTGTFATQSAQSGTWNINNVSGTVSLPTGAATAAKQPALGTAGTPSTDVLSIQGVASGTAIPVTSGVAQGSTTSGQTVSPIGCRTLSSAPTDTTAQTNIPRCTTDGALSVGGAGTAGTASANVMTIQGVASMTPVQVQEVGGTTVGLTPFTLTAANTTNATNIKASAGLVDHISVYNNSATLAWVSFYDTASTPTCGTAIKYQTMIPANSTSGAGAVEDFTIGVAHASGIGICVTTGIAGTGVVAASAYVINVFYK